MVELSTEVIVAISLSCVVVVIIGTFIFIAIYFRSRLKKLITKDNMQAAYKPSLEEAVDQSFSTLDTSLSELNRSAFVKAVAKKHENDNAAFNQEFRDLPDYTYTKSSSVSRAHANRFKNRYSNIEAFNHSRVVIGNAAGNDDYINANFVQGFSSDKKFIATQGPKPETTSDFWRMISLHNVKAIVMLTNIIENGVVKCHQYWPEELNKTTKYGQNQVTLVEASVCGDYVKRKFDLITPKEASTNNKASYTTVTHYYYQKWYDRGVPDTYPISILKLVRDVNLAHPVQDYPIVVHCSAGVGRTGTYITLDAMLEHLSTSESLIDIKDFVSKIRMQRSYLVQTIAQYIFIHDSLNDYCLFGFTDIKMCDLPNAYRALKRTVSGQARKSSQETDQLRAQFDKLDIQKSLVTATCAAMENIELNRDVNVVCYDENRCQLSGDGGSYINASFILNSFIVTQDPMPSTIGQFWRMVLEYNVKVVLSLRGEFLSEHDDLNWPTPENPCCRLEVDASTRYEIKLLEKLRDEPVSPCITTRYLKIVNLATQQEFHVANLVVDHVWLDGGVLKRTGDALEIVKCVAGVVESCKETNIVIHDRTGSSNCILMCALYVLVDQLMFENCVDIFNVVKFLNTQRFNAKLNYEQYDFLYKCLVELSTVNNKKF